MLRLATLFGLFRLDFSRGSSSTLNRLRAAKIIQPLCFRWRSKNTVPNRETSSSAVNSVQVNLTLSAIYIIPL